MIARSQTEEEHLNHLHKLFERMKKYKLRLNPNKCTFGMRPVKLQGFLFSGKGIEVDPKLKLFNKCHLPVLRRRSEVY